MHVWFERIRAVQHLLQLGYTVVHSDADALWFKDPLPELDGLAKSGHDLVFSRGNAAGGKNAGHGLGVCGGFYYARPSPGSVAFFKDVLYAMHMKNMPDQPAMNSILWANGIGRSREMMDPDPWFGVVTGGSNNEDPGKTATRFALLPQVRYARHAGVKLVTEVDSGADASPVDIHVFHPVDEGYAVPLSLLPRFAPRKGEEDGAVLAPNATYKEHCGVGRWFEKVVFRTREQEVLQCAGLWLLRKLYKYGKKGRWPDLEEGQEWSDWLKPLLLKPKLDDERHPLVD